MNEELAQLNMNATLTSMAQVCRSFTEPALSMIWRSLVGFVPLLSVLPTFQGNGLMAIMFEESAEQAWHRFYAYASRVREFSHVDDALNSAVFRLLITSKMIKKRCIFPNLQTLNGLNISDYTSPVLIELLVPSSLRFLRTIVPEDESYRLAYEALLVGRILGILSTSHDDTAINRRTHLHHLELHAFVPSTNLNQLMSLRQLRFLHLMGITPEYIGRVDYLRGLSTLPHLQDLFLPLLDHEVFRPVPYDGFPSLERLSLQGQALSLQSFLSALPPHRLKYFRIFDDVCNWTWSAFGSGEVRTRLEEWRGCFCALVRQAETITDLHISLYSDTANPDDMRECAKNLPMMSIIKPLLELRALQTAELGGFINMPYSDADVHDIAAAWPKIETMALPPPCAEVMQPSLMSLRFFSKFCPNLGKLSIGLDVERGISVEPSCPPEQSKHLDLYSAPYLAIHPLKELDVCGSDLGKVDVSWLASQLRNWFPMLKQVTAAQGQQKAAKITAVLQQEKCNTVSQI